MIKLRHLKKMVETGFQHPVTKKYNPYYSILEYPSWWRKSKSSNAVSRMKRMAHCVQKINICPICGICIFGGIIP